MRFIVYSAPSGAGKVSIRLAESGDYLFLERSLTGEVLRNVEGKTDTDVAVEIVNGLHAVYETAVRPEGEYRLAIGDGEARPELKPVELAGPALEYTGRLESLVARGDLVERPRRVSDERRGPPVWSEVAIFGAVLLLVHVLFDQLVVESFRHMNVKDFEAAGLSNLAATFAALYLELISVGLIYVLAGFAVVKYASASPRRLARIVFVSVAGIMFAVGWYMETPPVLNSLRLVYPLFGYLTMEAVEWWRDDGQNDTNDGGASRIT